MKIELTPELHKHLVNLVDVAIGALRIQAITPETQALVDALSAPLQPKKGKK